MLLNFNKVNYVLKLNSIFSCCAHTLHLDDNGNPIYQHGFLCNNHRRIPYKTLYKITSIGSLIDKSVVAVARGATCTIALDSDGHVHAWGYSNIKSNDFSSVPTNIMSYGSFANKNIVFIASGINHHIALDSIGHVHVWGYSTYGELGLDKPTEEFSAVPINASVALKSSLNGKIINAIACGVCHTLALDNNGQIHGWGRNFDGAISNGINKIRKSVVISNMTSSNSSLCGKIVIAIACGAQHSVALDSNGMVHAWGNNEYGQLGNNTKADYDDIATNACMTMTKSSLYGKYIVSINCGCYYTIVRDSIGNTHAWGINESFGINNIYPKLLKKSL
jgi:alpha-tubulin suppressor-like RCC1 family protein